MKHFWKGFRQTKTGGSIEMKRHVIVVFLKPKHGPSDGLKGRIADLIGKYPVVKVKLVNGLKDETRMKSYGVDKLPSVVLLKDGKEIDRLDEADSGRTLLEHIFRRAHT